MELFVGLAAYRGKIEKYKFDLLELAVSPNLPRQKILRHFRAARPDLKFSLRIPPEVLDAGRVAPELIEKIRAAGEILAARFVVVATGPRFTPTKRNEERLGELVGALAATGARVAWEPRGVWNEAELSKWAARLDVVLVRDLTRDPVAAGEVVYTRLLPFGVGARVTQTALERLAERLEDASEAYVIVQAEGAGRARARLREWLGVGDEAEADDPSDDIDDLLGESDDFDFEEGEDDAGEDE